MAISKLPQVPPKLLIEVLEATYNLKGDATQERIIEYVGKTPNYVRKALLIGVGLGLLDQCSGVFKITSPNTHDFKMLVRESLGDYQPFVFYCSRINKGDSPATSARKLKALHLLENTPDEISKFFTRWGLFTDLLVKDDGKITLNFKLDSPIDNPFTSNITDRISARAFVLDNLNSYIESISQHEIDLLTRAVLKYQSDPRSSIDDAGRAIEDQLRALAKNAHVDVARKSGIIEIVNQLKTKNNNFLHSKHWELFIALGHVRNMAAHSKDRVTELPWIISPELALSYSVMAIRVLRSVYIFMGEQKRQDI